MNDKSKYKIIITGATGFLGSCLLHELVNKNYDLIVLKRSFSNIWRIKDILPFIIFYDIDKVDIKTVFEDNKIKGIIHLATDYGKINEGNIDKMFNANIELPAKLLDLGTKHGIDFFINTHTYADCKYNLYSATKSALKEIAKFYIANYKIKFINMRLEYIYGEKDDDTKFIPFVIKNIFEGKEIKASKGDQKRDFIYVTDVASAYIKVLENMKKFDADYIEFEIGTGKSFSFIYFVNKIEEEIGKNANIKWGELPYRKNEIFDSKANMEKAKEYLGWYPKYDIFTGLKETIDWYKREKINDI